MWDETRRELEGVAVVAPSLPPEGGGRTLSGWAAAVLGLVEGEIVPVGVSMGGYLAFELWRQAPERISGLVLSDTRAGPAVLEFGAPWCGHCIGAQPALRERSCPRIETGSTIEARKRYRLGTG